MNLFRVSQSVKLFFLDIAHSRVHIASGCLLKNARIGIIVQKEHIKLL